MKRIYCLKCIYLSGEGSFEIVTCIAGTRTQQGSILMDGFNVPMICITFVLFREREIGLLRAALAFAAAATPRVLRNSNDPIRSIVHLILNFLCSFCSKPLFKTSLKVTKDEVRMIQVKRTRSDNKMINYFLTGTDGQRRTTHAQTVTYLL